MQNCWGLIYSGSEQKRSQFPHCALDKPHPMAPCSGPHQLNRQARLFLNCKIVLLNSCVGNTGPHLYAKPIYMTMLSSIAISGCLWWSLGGTELPLGLSPILIVCIEGSQPHVCLDD
jgi:hypothetical protein